MFHQRTNESPEMDKRQPRPKTTTTHTNHPTRHPAPIDLTPPTLKLHPPPTNPHQHKGAQTRPRGPCTSHGPRGDQPTQKEHQRMKSLRILVGLTGLLTILAITATPAPAEFQANQPETTQGPAQLEAGTAATLAIGTSVVKCEELSKGEWHIQTKFSKFGKGPDGHTKVEQDKTKDGPHQAFSGLFTKCAGPVGVATVNTECELQAVQLSQTKFDGVVKKQCIVKTSECTIEVEAGNANFQLFNIDVTKVSGGTKTTATVEGVTVVAKGAACGVVGIKNNKESTFKATTIAHSEIIEP